jgi:hypothetical protein
VDHEEPCEAHLRIAGDAVLAHCDEPFGNDAFASGVGNQEAFLVTMSALRLALLILGTGSASG